MRRTYFKPNHWFITTAVLGNYAMVLSLNLCWIYDHKGIVTMTMAYWKDASLLPLATTRVYSQGTDTSLMQMVILLECRDLFFFSFSYDHVLPSRSGMQMLVELLSE